MKPKDQLDILISSQEEMVHKKALSPRGEGYLDGLKQARKIIFGSQIKPIKNAKTRH